MDEERLASKRHQLDLAGKKFELDQVFDSIINRLPDLCMPPSYRLAGEDDFFNCTKSIKLQPFKKQAVFETCISPELCSSNLASYSGAGGLHEITSPTRVESTIRKVARVVSPEAPNEGPSIISQCRTKRQSRSNQLSGCEKSKLSKEEYERKKKYEIREAIKRRYSNLNIKKRIHERARDGSRVGYDRLFSEAPASNYPYLNPIPDCMMTRDNIDNLRDIIVSAVDIEWKMLTPVRPDSEYEEKYFDRLIQLHRFRYKTRLETGYFTYSHRMVPFKHIRHTYMVQYGASQRKPTQTMSSPVAEHPESRRKFSSWHGGGGQRSKLGGESLDAKLNVPKLILTSDETTNNRPIVNSDSGGGGNLGGRENALFDYGHYSRFSKQNLRNTTSCGPVRSCSESRLATDKLNRINIGNPSDPMENDDVFEDRVEEILSKLVNINMNEG